MTLTRNDLDQLLSAGESQTVEFKERIREPRMLARIIAAMANTAGGTILVGLREPREMVGADVSELQRVYESALRRVRPTPRTNLQFISVDGRQVGVIQTEKAAQLVLTDDGALARVGETVRPMEPTAIGASLAKLLQQPMSEQTAFAEGIAHLTVRVEELSNKVDRANSIRGQMRNYLIGGAIGAILGWLLALLL
jgi:predicted HTH transcriptional regulator